jgi:FAD binding domain
MSKVRTALVVGGGIAGPVTALALTKAGIQATVFEAHPAAADGVGAMLSLAPNGLDALQTIGAAKAVQATGQPVPRVVIADGSGNQLAQFDGFPGLPATLAMARADLFRALADHTMAGGVPIHYGKRLVTAEQAPDGVTATFADGTTATAEVLIGADGIRSTSAASSTPTRPAPSTRASSASAATPAAAGCRPSQAPCTSPSAAPSSATGACPTTASAGLPASRAPTRSPPPRSPASPPPSGWRDSATGTSATCPAKPCWPTPTPDPDGRGPDGAHAVGAALAPRPHGPGRRLGPRPLLQLRTGRLPGHRERHRTAPLPARLAHPRRRVHRPRTPAPLPGGDDRRQRRRHQPGQGRPGRRQARHAPPSRCSPPSTATTSTGRRPWPPTTTSPASDPALPGHHNARKGETRASRLSQTRPSWGARGRTLAEELREALALERPAMTSVRGQLGDRLRRQLAHAYQQRRHPSSGRGPDNCYSLDSGRGVRLPGRPARSRDRQIRSQATQASQ